MSAAPTAVDFTKKRDANGAPFPVETPDPWSPLLLPAVDEWFTKAPPPRTWLLRDARRPKADGVLPLGKVGQLVAEGGAGKTMLLAQLAIAVSTGTRFLDALDVETPGRVLLALGEEDAEEVRRRLHRARRAANAPIPSKDSILTLPLAGVACALVEADENGNPCDTSFARWMRAQVVDHGPWALVVVDPLSRFAGADAETDNAAGTRYIQALESLAAAGPAVLGAHHTNKLARGRNGKVEAHGARGSSSITDGSRWVATLTREDLTHDDAEVRARLGEVVTLSFVKSNYSRKGEPVELRYDADNGGALVPLDDTDRDLVRRARSRRPETEQRESARADATRTRDVEDDAAACALVAERPDASVRQLVALLKKTRACGTERAYAAVVRAKGGTT